MQEKRPRARVPPGCRRGASSGSACAAGSIAPSHVLLAIGRNSDEAKGALRLSIDKDLTREDADYAIDALKAAVARLRG